MPELTKGCIDRIMNGEEVDEPILQVLGHKKLASSTTGERFRLLVSDGEKSNSFTMLATQLNHMITDNQLTENSIVRVNRYALSMVNNSGAQKRVMVILSLDILESGDKVGRVLGDISSDNVKREESKPAVNNTSSKANNPPPAARPQQNGQSQSRLNDSITNKGFNATPIAALSPYQHRWIIKARVTSKSPIRSWANSRGEGKLFSMDLVDESGEIKCTAWRDQVDKFYDMIEVGKIYYVSRCSLKAANKQYSSLNNDFEMSLTNDSEIVACDEDADEIPTIKFNFVPISQIENKQPNDVVDIIGVVKSYSDVQTVTRRTTNQELKKRAVNIVDQSNVQIELTLWGSQAEEFNGANEPIIAIKGARVGEFMGGKSLSTMNSSVLQLDPDIEEARRLSQWYTSGGQAAETRLLSRTTGGGGIDGTWATFREAQNLQYGHASKPNTYINKATINLLKGENALYKACPTEGCKKKVIDQGNGMFRCEKCTKDFDHFSYRLLASVNLVDWTGTQWATAFNEEAERMLNINADELGSLKESDEQACMEKISEAAFKTFAFKIRVRMDNYNDETRLKATIAAVQPVNFKVYTDHLFGMIKDLVNIKKN